jgi:predicted TIM-barrel fold metal-dependent hydrolase
VKLRKVTRCFSIFLALAAALALGDHGSGAFAAEPIIDMHVHATFTERPKALKGCTGNQPVAYLAVDPAAATPEAETEDCAHSLLSETRRAKFEADTIAALRNAGVRRAVLIGSPDIFERWEHAAPGLFIPAGVPQRLSELNDQQLRSLVDSGKVQVLAEAGLQYSGISADDPRAEPFWAFAEQRDIPVGIHLGMGMPLIGNDVRDDPYRAALTSPFQLEAVLKKHPRLRIYVMHAASPLIEEMIAMLFTYPSLYVDISANDWNMPRAQFYSELKRLTDAGFSKRIMFGSDQTIWPQAIPLAIQTIEQAPFLTPIQKRDILYNNAARFLRLTKAQIAADRAPLQTK